MAARDEPRGLMRSPGFWYRAPGLAAAVLHPLGSIYAAATARRLKRGARAKLAAPVICIGNLTAGGAGKTPVAMHVATELAGQGAAILSRGYGGRATGPLRVDPARH
ncbi:MAG: tetraacyldisaccharide 4'-kinase, partial [Pseudomonadota bacterium]